MTVAVQLLSVCAQREFATGDLHIDRLFVHRNRHVYLAEHNRVDRIGCLDRCKETVRRKASAAVHADEVTLVIVTSLREFGGLPGDSRNAAVVGFVSPGRVRIVFLTTGQDREHHHENKQKSHTGKIFANRLFHDQILHCLFCRVSPAS